MNSAGTINIGYNKLQGTGALLGGLYLLTLGIWRVIVPVDYSTASNVTMEHMAVAILIIGGGLGTFFSIKKLVSKSPLLTISDEGITNNNTGNSFGFVPWADVLEIGMKRILLQNFLVVVLKNPDQFINKQSAGRKKFTATANFRQTGSPFIVSLGALMGRGEDIRKLVADKFEAYKQKSTEGAASQP